MEILDDEIDFAAYLKESDAKTKVKPASEFVQDAKDRLRARTKTKRVFLPWPKCNENFEFRRGRLVCGLGKTGTARPM